MHNQAYFSIFTLIMPSKAIQFNKYSNCCWGTTRALLLSPTGSPRLSQLQSSSYASKNPGEAPCQGGTCRHLALHARAHSMSARGHAQSVWAGAGLQVLIVASRRTTAMTRKVILILRRFRKVLPCAHVTVTRMQPSLDIIHLLHRVHILFIYHHCISCIYMYILPILLFCPAAGAREMRRRRRGRRVAGEGCGAWGRPVGRSARRPGFAIPGRIRMSLRAIKSAHEPVVGLD